LSQANIDGGGGGRWGIDKTVGRLDAIDKVYIITNVDEIKKKIPQPSDCVSMISLLLWSLTGSAQEIIESV
jgi:hypothetical protein